MAKTPLSPLKSESKEQSIPSTSSSPAIGSQSSVGVGGLPAASHQMDADEEDENVKQLNECSAVYLALQECLVRTDRNWRSCQPEVQSLKACHARRSNVQKK